ncbi:MAG TPA: glycosyl hydrolase family 28-related protein [Rhodoblastus sp.]|nr:glycosyl hydrolase family 28-related protein [Rhodoblastus sp.]
MNFKAKFFGALLSIVFASSASAIPAGQNAPLADASLLTVTAKNGVHTTFGNWVAQTVNVRLYGAAGDGVTDDTAAFAAAIATVNSAAASGVSNCLFVPPGVYYINGATLPQFTTSSGGGVCGAGSWKSQIKIGPNYNGNLFSWNDTWEGSAFNSVWTTVTTPSGLGARVTGLTIFGSVASGTPTQNALVFYGRTDFLFVDDVDIEFINGMAFNAGHVLNTMIGYLRESRINNLRINSAGDATHPAFEIYSYCPQGGCDASNDINITNLDVLNPVSEGVSLRNNGTSSGNWMGRIHMVNVRVESNPGNVNTSTPATTGDLFIIGDSTLAGRHNDTECVNCFISNPITGKAGLKISGQGALLTAGILFSGTITEVGVDPLGGAMVDIEGGSDIQIKLKSSGGPTTNSQIIVASSTTVGGPITIDANGYEGGFIYSIDSTSQQYVTNGRGVSYSAQNTIGYIAPIFANNNATTGNARGSKAVDWQPCRGNGTQVASGANSTIAGGCSNTASGPYSFVGGGYGNTASGTRVTIAGGYTNSATGQYSAAVGGLYGADYGNYGLNFYASGDFSIAGDAEIAWGVLRASTSSTSATRLTSDGSGTANAMNVFNLANNMARLFDLTCLYRDTVTSAAATWSWQNVLVTRGVNASTTTASAPSVVAGPTIGSPGASAPTIAADTSQGGLSVTFTAPNTDASRIVCRASQVIAQ